MTTTNTPGLARSMAAFTLLATLVGGHSGCSALSA
jgi:hypothetical protein